VGYSVDIIGTRGYPSYYGGFETLVRHLAPYLVEHGWDVMVYGRHGSTASDDVSRDPRVNTAETWGVESRSLSTLSYGLSSSLRTARRRPDAALLMNVANGYWLPALKVRSIPTVLNVDGIEWERAKWGAAAKFAFRLGARLSTKFADRLVCDSRNIDQRWLAEFGRGGDFIPYGGIDPGLLPPLAGLEAGRYALVVARFVPENSINEFLEAAVRIAQEYRVVIVGSSGYGGEIEDSVRALSLNENITWMGHVSDDNVLNSLWQNCGAYFHGHSVGGTNPALVQAMWCGAPTVARDTVFNREVPGRAGTFVSPDPGAIGHEMLRLLGDNDRQEELGIAAAERAREFYTWESVCKSYAESLTSAIEKRRGSN
jgi:glycosyltransferase involved in cell wall biosynthesis